MEAKRSEGMPDRMVGSAQENHSVDGGVRADDVTLTAVLGRLSQEIGDARRRGADVQHLIERMRDLSAAPRPPGVQGVTITCSNASVAEWDAYVEAHPRATLYHRHCWRSIIRASFGHAAPYLEARDVDSRLRGVLPLVRQRSRLFGDYLASLPFVNYAGALADTPALEVALMRQAGALAASYGARHIEFREEQPRPDWVARTDKVSMRLALPNDSAELWKGFSSKLRAQIRRGERECPTVRIGGRELVPDFYRVFARNMRDLGTPVYARNFFETILERVSGHARVIVVDLQGAPTAAAVLLGDGRRLEIPWAASLREANPLAVNMVLYWHALQHAIEFGHTEFDFGRSTEGSGTYRFKRQWGAQAVPLHWHYWLPDGAEPPRLNPDNPKFRMAIAAWRRVPLWVANAIGPRIVKNLP
jgi:serine/alanine adding enzyme